jgi:hypothetical protein
MIWVASEVCARVDCHASGVARFAEDEGGLAG